MPQHLSHMGWSNSRGHGHGRLRPRRRGTLAEDGKGGRRSWGAVRHGETCRRRRRPSRSSQDWGECTVAAGASAMAGTSVSSTLVGGGDSESLTWAWISASSSATMAASCASAAAAAVAATFFLFLGVQGIFGMVKVFVGKGKKGIPLGLPPSYTCGPGWSSGHQSHARPPTRGDDKKQTLEFGGRRSVASVPQ